LRFHKPMNTSIEHSENSDMGMVLPELNLVLETSRGYYKVHTTEVIAEIPLEDMGFLSFHLPASKISAVGADPRFVFGSFFLPEIHREIVENFEGEAQRYHARVESKVVYGRKRALAIVSIRGEVREIILPTNIKVGDLIVLIGVPGAEFLYLIANRKPELFTKLGMGDSVLRWKRALWMLTCVDAAKTTLMISKVNGLICVDSNGILESLNKLADLSGTGFMISRDSIEFPPELVSIATQMNLDPLRLPSSGVVLAAIPKYERVDQIREILEVHGYKVSFIGNVSREVRVIS
jgi:hydrogenase expression/formation protein HypE